MAMLKEIIVHVAVASVLLGTLRKAGVITTNDSMIPHPTARRVFASAIAFGEAVASAAMEGVVYTKRMINAAEAQ